jgi:predicted MFS family arabinose efflux permease
VGSRVVLGSETGGGAAHNVDLPDFGERVSETLRPLFWLALALSVGAAVSLGVTRFAYGLLLPGMRTDLGWTYTLAGAMNTANAVGYLLGALAGYCLFGVGYIGYMTFAVALLRAQGASAQAVTVFYGLLGLAVVASSRIWAGLLNRHQGGGAMSCLNALLGLAVVLPALTQSFSLIVVSGLLFGGVFLSVVASSTALVRHNLAPSVWAEGISAFTVVFAAGQIVGPTLVGWIADGAGGLQRGLLVSALALWLGAVLAWRQRPLDTMPVSV